MVPDVLLTRLYCIRFPSVVNRIVVVVVVVVVVVDAVLLLLLCCYCRFHVYRNLGLFEFICCVIA